MTPYRICVVGGHCGVRMMMVAEHLEELLQGIDINCQVSHRSLWDHPTPPRSVHLILELLPAYTEDEAGCPVIFIKPLLADLDHPETIDKIITHVQSACIPAIAMV